MWGGPSVSSGAGIHGLSEIYGYIWYLHAFLTAAFLVYLPFSKMFHLIMAPVVIALNAGDPLTTTGIILLTRHIKVRSRKIEWRDLPGFLKKQDPDGICDVPGNDIRRGGL